MPSFLKKPPSTPVVPSSFLPNIVLRGERVTLRPPHSDDAEAWVEVRERNRTFLKNYEPSWPATPLATTLYAQRLARQAAEWRLDRTQPFFIFDTAGALIGGININNICRGAAQFASLGYWIDEQRQGQGFMGDALRLLITYAFTDASLHRLNASCLPDNARSRRLLLGAGFAEEGFAAHYLEIDGQWQDHILFGLPIERWSRRS